MEEKKSITNRWSTNEEFENSTLCNANLGIKINNLYDKISLPDEVKEILKKLNNCTSIYNPFVKDDLLSFIEYIEFCIKNNTIELFLKSISFIWDIQESSHSNDVPRYVYQNKKQAWQIQQESLKAIFSELEPFIMQVDEHWTGKGDFKRNASCTKEKSISKVWEKNEKAIGDILEKHKRKNNVRAFKQCFDSYLELCKKNNSGITLKGKKLEQRKPRSAESKENSRQGALRKNK